MHSVAWEVRNRVKDAFAALNAELRNAAQHGVVVQVDVQTHDGHLQIDPVHMAILPRDLTTTSK